MAKFGAMGLVTLAVVSGLGHLLTNMIPDRFISLAVVLAVLAYAIMLGFKAVKWLVRLARRR